MRMTALLAALCVLVGVVGFAVRGCAPAPADIDRITAEDVASIEVQSEGVLQHTPPAPGVGRFTAAPDDHARLVGLIQGGEVDRGRPKPWVVLGAMSIRLRDGRNIPVSLFWTGQERGAYSIGRKWYRGSSDEELIRTLAECAKRGTPTGVTP